MTIHTRVGTIRVDSVYGQERQSRRWLCPLQERLGLDHRAAASPELKELLCFLATQSLSYAAAAQIAERLELPGNDSMIQRYVQEAGHGVDRLRRDDVQRAIEPATRAETIAQARAQCGPEPFSLVVMLDGWMIRERGGQWGLKPPEQQGERVAWREMKTGIVFRIEDQARTQSGRGLVIEKHTEAWRGEARELGERLFALALRKGLYQARRVFVVADGGLWIWNVAGERFAGARQLLDYYHASQHLHALAAALHPDPAEAKAWVAPLLHQLKHGGEAGVVDSLEQLTALIETLEDETARTVANTQAYFATHRHRLAYAEAAAHGCPIGSGAMESTCAQLQDRFKRTGQFWTQPGAHALMTLELIRKNEDWQHYFNLLWSQ